MGVVTDEKLRGAEATGKRMLATVPRAVSARYNWKSGRVVIELTNGCSYAFPAAPVQDLRNALQSNSRTCGSMGMGST